MGTLVKKVDLGGLSSANPKVKYGTAKKILAIARENPAALAGERDFFLKMLDSENKIMKWTAIDMLGALSTTDAPDEALLARFIGFLNSGALITANHAIAALGKIAATHTGLRNRILAELLKVEHYDYATPECRNIAIGKVLEELDVNWIERNKAAITFVKRQAKNSRNATRKKAEKLLKKLV